MQRRFRRLLAGICLAAALATLGPPTMAAPAAAAPLILISIDGYRADYLDRGYSPTLAALGADGVRAVALRPVFPSLTFPNHYTLVTGLYPDQHGIINNTMRDPVLGDFSPSNRAANVDGRWWAGAEPLWVTAERHGRKTASIFWPGTQAEIRGIRPTYWQLFDPTVAADARVDQVLAWLDLPPDRRPAFVALYFEQADVAGHNYGPDSLQLNEALVTVDSALKRLMDGLRQRKLFDATNVVIVSDHGMSPSSPDRIVLLDQLVSSDKFELVTSITVAGINPKPAYATEVQHALLAPHAHLNCWKKENSPAKYHYGRNPRIPAILCVAAEGWMVSTTAVEDKRSRPLLGEHGYDIDEPTMGALFVARGPAFRQHLVVPEFDNINVYALLAKALGIEPLPNGGTERTLSAVLRPQGASPQP